MNEAGSCTHVNMHDCNDCYRASWPPGALERTPGEGHAHKQAAHACRVSAELSCPMHFPENSAPCGHWVFVQWWRGHRTRVWATRPVTGPQTHSLPCPSPPGSAPAGTGALPSSDCVPGLPQCPGATTDRGSEGRRGVGVLVPHLPCSFPPEQGFGDGSSPSPMATAPAGAPLACRRAQVRARTHPANP